MSQQDDLKRSSSEKVVSGVSRRVFLKGTAGSIAALLAAQLPSQRVFGAAPKLIQPNNTVIFALQEFAHDAIRSVLPDFESATGLTVQLEGGPVSGTDMLTRYSAAFASGNSPVDLFSDSDESSPAFMRAGWVLPLNDIIPEATWADFPPSMQPHIDGFLSIDGVRYRIPHEFAVGYFFTRRDLLDQANLAVPTTWEEMVSVGQELSDPASNIYGTTDALIKPALLYVYIAYLAAQSGGEVFRFDEATGEALQFVYDMIYTHRIFPETALNQDYTAQNALYMDDRIAFMRQWPFFQDVAQGNSEWFDPQKVRIELPPAGSAGSKSWIGGWGFSLPTSAPNPDGGQELLRYLTSPEIAPLLAQQQGFLLTPRTSILDALAGEENPLIEAIGRYSEANVFAARPFHPRVAEAQTIVDDMASLFLTNQASLSEVLAQGQELISALDT